MTGFFAEFKNAGLVLVIAALAARPKFNRRKLFAIGAAVFLFLAVAVFWSSVKYDYRLFVNQGSGAQVVLVPLGERVEYISDHAANFSAEDLQIGINLLVARHGYIDYLAQTMQFVPQHRPHENGSITWSVVRHIAMPRIFFPDKPPLLSDTLVTGRYTGNLMTKDSNASISIGYLGELYVDFGYVGGLVGVLAIGFIVGSGVRTLALNRNTPDLLNAGLCVMASLPLAYFGTAYVKLIGALIFSFVVAWLFQRVAWRYVPGASALQRARAGVAKRNRPHR